MEIDRRTAFWVNGLGEECSSMIRAEFTDRDGRVFVVVYDWREATRGHGFIVIPKEDCTHIRVEHWNAR